MFRKIKDDFWMLRRSGRNILVFELTYKLAATAVFYPIAILIINLVMKAAGAKYLTNEYIIRIFKNPVSWIVMLAAVVIFVFYCIISYINFLGGMTMLKEVKIELTNRCARNCKHCSSSATNSSNNVKELGFEDVKKIIYEAKDMNVETIVFTGGEPLMYERLPELVKLTSKLGLKSTIYTFAYKTDETLNKYRQLIDFGLNKIVYSLAESLSNEEDASVYDKAEFFDKVFDDNSARLGFHYTVSKDSFSRLEQVVNETIDTFKTRSYFDKVSLLRFVPHGKGTIDMDLSKEELLAIKKLYLNSNDKDKIRLGTPWNILGIENTPCIIADEIMIIGFDGIAYPCDSIKYFKKIGISGNIKENTLEEMYNSSYFSNIRSLNTDNSCSTCKDYKICKSGCIGQKIIANYIEDEDKVEVLKKCINSRDPKCMR